MFKNRINMQNILLLFKQKRRLQTDILFESLFILSISIFLIIAYTFTSNTSSIMELSKNYIARNTERIKDMIGRGLSDTQQIIGVYVPLLTDIDLLKITDHAYFLNSLQYFLESNSQVSTAYIGTPAGKFVEFATPRIVLPYMKKLGITLPENTSLVIKEIDHRKVENKGGDADKNNLINDTADFWFFVDMAGKISPPHSGEKTGYDHRKRDWYINSTKTQNLIWSNIYVFESTLRGESGVTASKSIFDREGKLKGVLGVDITLQSFSSYLSKYLISKNSTSYVINVKNQIVATSNLKSNVVMRRNEFSMMTVEESNDLVLLEALNQFNSQGKNQNQVVSFTVGGNEYIAGMDVLERSFVNNEWKVIVVLPTDDFVGGIRQNRNMTLMYSMIILFVAFLWTFRLARRISKPIVQLAGEARKIQELDVYGKTTIISRIKEINDLSNAMSSLKTTMQSFSYYVPKKLVKQLIGRKQSIQVGGRSKEVTLMFTDVENFTTVSENLGADKLFSYLSEYFEELTKIIIEANGTVDNYIGDAIMAFWGAPVPDRHHIYNACHAALLCQKRLADLNRVWKREGRPVFNTRMGIHVGEVIVGNIGSSERMNYTAIGDNVNLCARLEGLNKGYGTSIMVSEAIFTAMKDSFLFRHMDNVAVKGKSKAVKIYELVAQIKGDNSLLPTDEQIEFVTAFEKAYKLFLTRQFAEAREHFEKIKSPSHADRSVAMYVERCKIFKEAPPPKEWDGTVVMHEK